MPQNGVRTSKQLLLVHKLAFVVTFKTLIHHLVSDPVPTNHRYPSFRRMSSSGCWRMKYLRPCLIWTWSWKSAWISSQCHCAELTGPRRWRPLSWIVLQLHLQIRFGSSSPCQATWSLMPTSTSSFPGKSEALEGLEVELPGRISIRFDLLYILITNVCFYTLHLLLTRWKVKSNSSLIQVGQADKPRQI